MTPADLLQSLRGRPRSAFVDSQDGLFESRHRVEMLGTVEKLLIGRGILNHDFGLAVDRQDEGRARLLQVADKLRGSVSEVGQRIGFNAKMHLSGLHGQE